MTRCHPPDENRCLCDIVKRRASEETRRVGLVLLSVSVCDAFSTQGALLFSPGSSPSFFPSQAFFPSRCPPVRARTSPGTSSAILPATKVEFLATVGALVRKTAAPPPPLTFRGRNLSLADDPLKRICPHTHQCALRAATREVIQRHATGPPRLT